MPNAPMMRSFVKCATTVRTAFFDGTGLGGVPMGLQVPDTITQSGVQLSLPDAGVSVQFPITTLSMMAVAPIALLASESARTAASTSASVLSGGRVI